MTNTRTSEGGAKRPLVEVCIGSVADALAAEAAGADRLELCSATELGGLTPSMGLVGEVLQAVKIPVVAMVRPRPGGFCYTDAEFRTAQADAQLMLERGVSGIVFGFLQSDGQVDLAKTATFVRLAGAREAVFHRAFEFVPDPMHACQQLADQGVTRLLTSGQAADAISGAELIRSLVENSRGQLQVLPGGGIRAEQAARLCELTGADQLHIGASSAQNDGSLGGNTDVDFCGFDYLREGRYRAVDASRVAAVVAALQ